MVDFSKTETGYEKENTICPSCKFQTKTFKKEDNTRICRTCGADKDAPPKQEIVEMIKPEDRENINEQIRIEKRTVDVSYILDDLWESKTNLAEKFIEQQPLYYDHAKIWWTWNHQRKCWEMIDETDILIQIDRRLAMRHESTKMGAKNELLEAFRRVARQNKPEDPPKTWLQFHNKVVDVDTGEETDPTPQYFFSNPIPWDIRDSEDTPEMDKVFMEWVGEDKIRLLYEILAFCLSPEYFLHRIFCFVGSGSNGKSRLMDIASQFVGLHNTTSTDIKNLTNNRFGTIDVYKKLICFIGETNYEEIKNTDIIKRLCGEDLLRFEMKHKDQFQGKSYAKLLVSTNSLPPTSDKTDGWYRRWMIIDFPNKFSEETDVLSRIPTEEYPRLARKCVNLLGELRRTRRFTGEGSIEIRKQRYEDFSNPLSKFIREFCEYSVNGHYFKYELRDDFKAFCVERGFREWSDHIIGKRMKEEECIDSGKIGKEVYADGKFQKKFYHAWLGINKKIFKGTKENPEISTISSISPIPLLPYIHLYTSSIEKPEKLEMEELSSLNSHTETKKLHEEKIIFNVIHKCSICESPPPCGFHPESHRPVCFNCWEAEQDEAEDQLPKSDKNVEKVLR